MALGKNQIKHTHTIIISDLHLGSPVSQSQKALKILKGYKFRKLILLGDIFDDLDFRNLPREAWEFLAYIGRISKDKKIRWVIGNHDKGLIDVFSSLMDAKVYEEYSWQFGKEKYLAIHGHQFDRFLVNNAFISSAATVIYNFIQRIDTREKRFSHFLKRKSKGWLRLSEKVAGFAMRYARKKDADYVFCGHTHKALSKSNHDIQYFNSGCWTDDPCSYITIDKDKVGVHYY